MSTNIFPSDDDSALVSGEHVLPVCYVNGRISIDISDKPLTGTWEVQARGTMPTTSLDNVVFLLKRIR